MNKSTENTNFHMRGKFDVEHLLDTDASSYCTFAAESLYNEKILQLMREESRSFHIYLIGFTPKMVVAPPKFEKSVLYISIAYMGRGVDLMFDVPAGFKFVQTGDQCHFEDENGKLRWIDPLDLIQRLSMAVNGLPFLVKYIGQSYGDDGSRNAIDRLLKHETLQKIAIKGIPEGYTLQLILLEIQADNRIITVLLPDAQYRDDDGSRKKMGLDKLFGTSVAERIALYEASLIRYFAPEFNKEFKNSFPSTNLKILQDCYKKDFLAVSASICIDDFPFYLHSESVARAPYHIVTHDIQKDDERKSFFGMTTKKEPN